MSRLHTVIGVATICLSGLNARADALSRNTETAKLAHDKALQVKAASAQRLVDMQNQRRELWEPLAGPLKFPETDEQKEWCKSQCPEKLKAFFDDKQQFVPDKLPDQQVFTDAISALGATPAPASLDKVAPSGSQPDEQKALLALACVSISPGAEFPKNCKGKLTQLSDRRSQDAKLVAAIQTADKESKDANTVESYTQKAYEAASTSERNAADTQVSSLPARFASVRRARCATAYCWGGDDGRKMAIEPILDLPVGMYWAVGGSALADYVNANNIKIQFNAGLRYWFSYDVMSVGILLAQPDLTGTSSTISFRGKSLANSQMRRPYPTLVIGFGADILQLSISYDELRNAPSSNPEFLPEFRPNQVLSRAVVFGVAITPLTAARNGIGASNSQTQETKK